LLHRKGQGQWAFISGESEVATCTRSKSADSGQQQKRILIIDEQDTAVYWYMRILLSKPVKTICGAEYAIRLTEL
jgi:hypothetical protein